LLKQLSVNSVLNRNNDTETKKRKRNRMKNKVTTRFEPDTRFELKPAAAAPFRAAQESRFENLKSRLLLERIESTYDPELGTYLRRAANDAAALAWITPYPLLVFPALFDEKADIAEVRVERQQLIRQVSRELLAV